MSNSRSMRRRPRSREPRECNSAEEERITNMEQGCLIYLSLAEMTESQQVESEQDDGTVRIYTVGYLRRSLKEIQAERLSLGLAPLGEQPPLILYPTAEEAAGASDD